MKTTTVVGTAAEDYIHIILLSWPPVLNTHLVTPYYILCALHQDVQDLYFPSLLQTIFAQDLRGFQPLSGPGRLRSFVTRRRRRIVKTVRKQRNVLPQREWVIARVSDCLNNIKILLFPSFVCPKWENRQQIYRRGQPDELVIENKFRGGVYFSQRRSYRGSYVTILDFRGPDTVIRTWSTA